MTLPPIVIDTREQTPLRFPEGVETIRATLRTGDYSVGGYEDSFAIERKSLADLVNTVIHGRDRFERELARMDGFKFRRLLVTCPFARVDCGGYDFSKANPKAVVASVNAFEVRYGVPVVYAADATEAARRVLDWAHYFVREVTKRNPCTLAPARGDARDKT